MALETHRQVAEQIGRGVVHVVRVLDLDRRRGGQLDLEESQDALVELLALSLLGEERHLGGGREVRVERAGEEREPGKQVGREREELVAEPLAYGVVGVLPADVQELTHQLAPHDVRRVGRIGLARRPENPDVKRGAAELLEETRLADPGLAHDVHEPAVAGRARPPGRPGALPSQAHDRRAGIRFAETWRVREPIAAPTAHARTGLRLPLDGERLELRRFEEGVGAVEHIGGRVDQAGLGLGHQPRRQVHGVAHDRVRASVPRADVAREDRPAVHADPDRDRRGGIDDPPQGEQHPLLVVAGDRGRARRQDQLATVGVDVGREERDTLFLGGLLHDRDQLVEATRWRPRDPRAR